MKNVTCLFLLASLLLTTPSFAEDVTIDQEKEYAKYFSAAYLSIQKATTFGMSLGKYLSDVRYDYKDIDCDFYFIKDIQSPFEISIDQIEGFKNAWKKTDTTIYLGSARITLEEEASLGAGLLMNRLISNSIKELDELEKPDDVPESFSKFDSYIDSAIQYTKDYYNSVNTYVNSEEPDYSNYQRFDQSYFDNLSIIYEILDYYGYFDNVY